jgi:hypothetical protein
MSGEWCSSDLWYRNCRQLTRYFVNRIIGDDNASSLGVIPQDCKDGNMGNGNLYHFCLAVLIFMDITVPLALIAVVVWSSLTSTLALYPFQEVAVTKAAEVKQAADVIVPEIPTVSKAEDVVTPLPAAETLVYVGQA